MEPKFYNASAPGSIMLFGEHAVLRYNEAIVCAIDKRITVRLYPQVGDKIIIRSNEFKEYITSITALQMQAPYEYILAAILLLQQQLTSGFIIEVDSTFPSTVGFGSSAAVTVAIVAVLAKWLGISCAQQDIFIQAKQVMLKVQGVGSGADLAASVYGGVLHYIREPFAVTQLPVIANIVAVYSGSKLKTKDVLAMVEQENRMHTKIYAHIFQGITDCVQQAVVAIQEKNWSIVGKLFSIQHGFMAALGVSNSTLEELVWRLKEFGAFGAKISGSGLGDCVIGIGDIPVGCFPANAQQKAKGVVQYPIKIACEGLKFCEQ
jgi:mevalonate kinase